MGELTIDQQRALAKARAKVRLAEATAAPKVEAPHYEFGQEPGADPSKLPAGYDPQTGNMDRVPQSEAYGRGAADVGSFSIADEVVGGLMSGAGKLGLLPGGDQPSYETVRDEIRARDAAAKEQHPNSYLTGQVGAGVAQTVLGGVPALMRGGASLLTRMLAGGATGAGLGAAHGAGSGTDAGSRILNALTEGAVGLGVGTALPFLGAGVSNAFNAVRDMLARTNMPASLDVMRILQHAVPNQQAAAQNIQAAGADAMLADAGPNARAVLDTAIQRGGPGADVARQAIADRTGRAGDQINQALDTTMGQPQGVETTRRAIAQDSAGARGTSYDDAYAAPVDYAHPLGQEVEGLLGRLPGSAWNRAQELMRLGGHRSQEILADIADDGRVVFRNMPGVRELDYITRALRDMATSGEGQGALGGQTALGRAYEGLSRDIRSRLRNLVPEYGQALETAADPIRRSQAVQFGSELLSKGTTREQVGQFVEGITGPERTAALQGVRSNLDDAMANVQRTVLDGNTDAREAIAALKAMSSRANREKVTALAGEDAANELFGRFDEAAHALELRAAAQENSKTYARQTVDRRVREITDGGAIGAVLEGRPVNATQRVIQTLTGRTPERLAQREDAIYSQLANLLTRPAGTMLPAIGQMGRHDLGNQMINERIIRALTGAIGPATALAGPSARDQLQR